ncbi:hypothetical protein SAMN05660991_02596 [Trujillonella endophytica]|uniref:Uncharacterized protein n=2 Tax=Trujillonella endophytica TaxID=673521 RepID=A0A1H8U0H3_9ACTN|nr:hypothetical protein SAMN05660991_02596 [Trujillella endophytica]
MPWQAAVAAGVGLFGVVPLAFTVFVIYALGGLDSDTARDPWIYPLFLAPLLVLVGSLLLLAGRSRVWLVVGAAAAVGAGLTIIGVGSSAGEPVGAWPLLLALCPVVAAAIALRPPVGRWLAGRPGRVPPPA